VFSHNFVNTAKTNPDMHLHEVKFFFLKIEINTVCNYLVQFNLTVYIRQHITKSVSYVISLFPTKICIEEKHHIRY
jgi:hypothetical protein